jgi:hypothetical protein
MPDAALSRATEEAPRDVGGGARRPRISQPIFWLGLVTSVFVGATLTLFAYADGLAFDQIPHLDKAVHFGMGGALAFFLDGVLKRRMIRLGSSSASVRIPLAALLVLVPSGVEEFVQRFSTHRVSSFGDFAADVAGVVFSIWLSRRFD